MSTFTRKKIGRAAISTGAVAALVLGVTNGAAADHKKGTYGTHGYQWFARFDDSAIAYVTSNYCNSRETGAYTRITNSTDGSVSWMGQWPSGIILSQQRCDGEIDDSTDIQLNYLTDFATSHGNYGGQNHSYPGPSSWCAVWNAPFPCGYHVSEVHLNKSRFTSSSYSTTYRERLIMHETGHSLGLSHHCSSDAIMNDGTSVCNGGAWTSTMTYQPTDREGIYRTYPNFMYP